MSRSTISTGFQWTEVDPDWLEWPKDICIIGAPRRLAEWRLNALAGDLAHFPRELDAQYRAARPVTAVTGAVAGVA